MKRVVYDEVSRKTSEGTCCSAEEGRTRQEFGDECDLNKIVARAERSGVMPIGREDGVFADLSGIRDLHGSLEEVRRAGEAFAALPAKVRNAFDNDVVAFTEAFQSKEGIAQLVELGAVAPDEETLADRREAAAEARAAKRAAAREEAKRVEAAKSPPPVRDG